MPAARQTSVPPAVPYIRLVRDRDLLETVLSQFKRLYIRLRRRWIEQTPDGTYLHHEVTGPAGQERGWLNDQILRDHLLGRRTIGVFHGATTSVFSFDLDFQTDDEMIRVNMTRSFLKWLEQLLGPECCHVWHTASKGYRVEIFLSEPTDWPRLSSFFALVLDTPWYEDAPADQRYTWRHSPYLRIETRPESPAGGRGVKLPLCVDRRNGRFCTFLDPRTLEPVDDPYEYLLGVNPIHPSVLPTGRPLLGAQRQPLPVPDTAASPCKDPLDSSFELSAASGAQLVQKCERLWRDGLTAPGTRHAALLLLARWHRWRKPDLQLNELEHLLIAWTQRELRFRRHLIGHDAEHCIRDAKSVALSAIRGRYSLAAHLDRMPLLTGEDLAALASIRSTDQRLVFLALLLHRSLYAGPSGEFYMAYTQIADLLGWTLAGDAAGTSLPDKPRVGRAVRNLLRNYPNLLTKVKPADQPRRLATHYRISLPMPAECEPNTALFAWPQSLSSGSVTLDLLSSLDTSPRTAPHTPPTETCHPLAFSSPLPPSGFGSCASQPPVGIAASLARRGETFSKHAGEEVCQDSGGACSPASPPSPQGDSSAGDAQGDRCRRGLRVAGARPAPPLLRSLVRTHRRLQRLPFTSSGSQTSSPRAVFRLQPRPAGKRRVSAPRPPPASEVRAGEIDTRVIPCYRNKRYHAKSAFGRRCRPLLNGLEVIRWMAKSARQADVQLHLTPDERLLLQTLAERGPCNQKDLREATGLGRWKAHTLLLRLEVLGLIAWREHGRSKDYMLTPSAENLREPAMMRKEEVRRA